VPMQEERESEVRMTVLGVSEGCPTTVPRGKAREKKKESGPGVSGKVRRQPCLRN